MTKQQMEEMGFRVVRSLIARSAIVYATEDPTRKKTRTLLMLQRDGVRETMLVEQGFGDVEGPLKALTSRSFIEVLMWVHRDITTIQPRGIQVPAARA